MYNPTCVVSGRTDNLQMHALRNDKGDMTGWFFVCKEFEKDLIKIRVTTELAIVRHADGMSKDVEFVKSTEEFFNS